MAYGDKRDYPKIDIYGRINGQWRYLKSTTWARSLKEAKERFCAASGNAPDSIKCHFDKEA